MSRDVVDLGTFTRQWGVEGRRIAWLLGAGASSSANVPTAGQITLDLLAQMYAAAHGVVLQSLNLGDHATRQKIAQYYDGMNGMPPTGHPSDYSTAFQLALPDEGRGVSTCAVSSRIDLRRTDSGSSVRWWPQAAPTSS